MDLTSLPGFFGPEYIEPTLCFTTDRMKISETYPLDKLPVRELARPDQVLVEFTDSDLPESDRTLRRRLAAGDNTSLSDDGRQILSSTVGYPHLDFSAVDEGEEKTLTISVEPLFRLSRDRMEAFILIKPLLFNYTKLTSEDLYKLLTEAGIVEGVQYKQLNLTKEHIRNASTDSELVLLAKGRAPEAGDNAFLKFHLQIGPIAGELLDNGSIDFRERKIMVPVSEGQIIATKIPPTRGKPGMTVLGERIAQQQGKDMEVETVDHAVYSPETKQVTAAIDGVLSVINRSVVKVCSKLEITGDIDYSTGNIESKNSVVIHGSVLPGFLVKTGGDLEIKGSVNATQISSLANIVVKGGILGSVSSVKAVGDVDLNFVEQGLVYCEGNCVIRRQCYYSRVYAGGAVRCKENCTTVGGELVAEGSITLGEVGAPGSDPCFIAAGVVAERLFHSRKFMQRLEGYEASIMSRLKGYTGTARKKKLRMLKGGFEQMKLRYLRINMIPQTGLYSRPPEDNGNAGKASAGTGNGATGAEGSGFDITAVSIDVHGTVFAGTRLQIGNRSLTVTENMSRKRFTLDDAGRHIISLPL